MPILGIDKKRKDSKFVGVYLPPRVFNYVTLFSLARGISKSYLFKALIDDWMNSKEEGTEEELIEELVIRVNNEWQIKKKTHPRAHFNEFVTSLQNELLSKGVSTKQIMLILSQIKG
jgi:hypothetical protein